ncbi:hypothetical protein Bca4012_026371 [Brassica carinata]
MEEFLELEEWLEDLDQNLKQKLDDQHTSGKGSIEEIMHMSKTSHPATEEADGFHKILKRIYDPVKLMVPCAVFEAESLIPPDKGVYLSSYIEVLDDQQHIEASQKGLRFIDEVDKGPTEAPSSDISNPKSIDCTTSSSIDTYQIPSIDTLRESEQNEFEVCQNIFDGDTTTRSDKFGGKKRRNWKKRKRIKDGIRKFRVRSRCFSQPFAKLRALLIAEMIDKGEKSMEEAFTQE